MKTYISVFIFTIFLSLFPETLHSQDSIQYKKLYLHTDRDQYFLGDTIWYKGYYLNGQSNKFIPGLITMYVDVINESGESVVGQVVAIDNGAANGAIDIPISIEPGEYMIRAFTEFQKQFGEDAFFYKQVLISKLESFVEGANQAEPEKLPEIDVAFLPEGGILLEGQENTVGIKAIDTHGNGVEIQGAILDSKEKSVATFTTSYKGMSSIRFVPQKGESYTARVVQYPNFEYTFEDIIEEGIKIEFKRESAKDLFFQALLNSESLIGRTYYFAISHHGEVIFHKKFVPKKSTFPITVIKDALPAGINRMVLLDEQLLPVSERLYFSTNYQINEIKIKPDKKSYETRSQVRLRLSDGSGMDKESWSSLSMVVVDEFASNKEGPSMNILSWLLIDSELKGHIEAPQDYFSDAPEIASDTKLDLLMQTQGWSRYIWSKPDEYMAMEASEEEGFNISGTVNRVVGNRPATKGTVDLKIYSSDFLLMDEGNIDKQGRFSFKGVSFLDTASVFLQARNKNEKLSFEISLDPFFNSFPMASTNYLPNEVSLGPKKAEQYQKQYDNLQALKEYTLKSGGFYLDEVTITESRRIPDDGHFRIYAKPSNSIKLPEKDIGAVSIFDYIRTHFSGVIVTSTNTVIIGGPSSFSMGSVTDYDSQGTVGTLSNSGAMLLLDGIQVPSDLLESVSMNQIDVIEILKFPHEYGIYGTRASNGVVAVYSKKGIEPDYSQKYVPGTIAKKLEGYSSNREFYSPRYTPETIISKRPDHRIVQFWEPNILTEKGKASVSFFSSDDITRYKVYVEGITNEGSICLGTSEFDVDQKNDQVAMDD